MALVCNVLSFSTLIILGALEEQRKQYEEEIERLRRHTPIDSMPETFHTNDGRVSLTTSGYGSRLSDREGSNANLLDDRNHDILERYPLSSNLLHIKASKRMQNLCCVFTYDPTRSYFLFLPSK